MQPFANTKTLPDWPAFGDAEAGSALAAANVAPKPPPLQPSSQTGTARTRDSAKLCLACAADAIHRIVVGRASGRMWGALARAILDVMTKLLLFLALTFLLGPVKSLLFAIKAPCVNT